MKLKLQQGQIWKKGDQHFRIVHLERLSVGYKDIKNLETKEGAHQTVTKKEFCRLIKGAELLGRKVPNLNAQPLKEGSMVNLQAGEADDPSIT